MKYFTSLILLLTCTNVSIADKNSEYTKSSKIFDSSSLYDDWWKNGVFYQIYPRSFKDSDNDGSGDLQGIIQKLDHLKDMNVDGFWISPIYPSPQIDTGYDISNYRDVDKLYGSLEDLRQLVDEAHKRGLKVILDYVPNHTSDQHQWFQSSLQRDPKYDDFYIWKNATYVNGERRPPNNWLSTFRGSAWQWNEQRQQYYFHQFAPAQPDLNYRNPAVVQEMKDVLKYWLDFGVDGFRMDAVYSLFEDEHLKDEPLSGLTEDSDDYSYLNHIYTSNQNETLDMIYQFRDVMDEFNAQNKTHTRIMMTEVYSEVDQTMRYYVNEDRTRYGAHFTFNFITFILYTKNGFNASDLDYNIEVWLSNIPENCTSNWVLGNHDQRRVASRLGVENVDALNMLAALLPGVQITYQGEEIGQENGEVTCQQGYDPQAIKNCSLFNDTSRDFERTPFQWDGSKNAGFTEADTAWLPVSKKYLENNLALQNVSGVFNNSHYATYKRLIQIKKEITKNVTSEVVSWGHFPNNVFYLNRSTRNANYTVLFNVADSEQLAPNIFESNSNLEVAVRSVASEYRIGEAFNLSQPLKPREAVVIKIIK